MLRSRPPWEHAFRDKYRPRTPGGLQLQQPRKGETKSLRVPAKGSADTWCGQPGRGAATRRRGVQGRAGPRGMAHHRKDRFPTSHTCSTGAKHVRKSSSNGFISPLWGSCV